MTTGRPQSPRAASFETHDGVEPVEAEWEALAARTAAAPFVRPGWIAAWYEAFGRGRPLVAALRRDGVLVALAALDADGGVLRSATNWHTPLYDVVAESAEAARELAEAVLAAAPRRLELRFLDREGLALPAFAAAAGGGGFRAVERVLLESPYVPTGKGDWSAYSAGLSKAMLSDVGRRRRRLERERGSVSFHVETAPSGDVGTLEDGFRLEASGWKGRSGTAIVSQPETREFYTAVAGWAAERGWLRLSFLSVDGRPIAFQLDLEADGVVYHLKPGYDEEYARYSPGLLLTEHVVRTAFERGASSYEFLGAADTYKLRWARGVRERLLLQAFAPTPAGLAEFAAFRFGRPAALRALSSSRRAKALLRR